MSQGYNSLVAVHSPLLYFTHAYTLLATTRGGYPSPLSQPRAARSPLSLTSRSPSGQLQPSLFPSLSSLCVDFIPRVPAHVFRVSSESCICPWVIQYAVHATPFPSELVSLPPPCLSLSLLFPPPLVPECLDRSVCSSRCLLHSVCFYVPCALFNSSIRSYVI